MRYIYFLLILISCFVAVNSQAQSGSRTLSQLKADNALKAAGDFEQKLDNNTATVNQAIAKWSATANDPDVMAEPNSFAIALASQGLLEIRNGNTTRADSLLVKAMPYFRRKTSKAAFLVQFAELERGMKKDPMAMRAYDEIVNTMDSVGALWNIEYYRLSGYAPYAYAIDACFGMEQIAEADTIFRKKAVALLTKTMQHHPTDALGLMAIVSLHRLAAMTNDTYKYQIDLLCSRKPELRQVSDTFEKKFSEAK